MRYFLMRVFRNGVFGRGGLLGLVVAEINLIELEEVEDEDEDEGEDGRG